MFTKQGKKYYDSGHWTVKKKQMFSKCDRNLFTKFYLYPLQDHQQKLKRSLVPIIDFYKQPFERNKFFETVDQYNYKKYFAAIPTKQSHIERNLTWQDNNERLLTTVNFFWNFII